MTPLRSRLPDFIIAGAPRSGTTWLYEVLDRHPDIDMAKPVRPEPKFFLVDALYERGLAHYAETWFAGLSAARLGEKTSNYLEDPRVAERICRHLPAVKLVFLLRDPVERAWSNYRWSVMNGLERESFAYALERESERELPEALRYARPFSYIARGYYAEMLERYLSLFPREQILVLKYEEIRAGGTALAARCHHFIGVGERPRDAEGVGVINAAAGCTDPMPADCRRLLRDIFAEPNRRLARLLGQEFTEWDQDDG